RAASAANRAIDRHAAGSDHDGSRRKNIAGAVGISRPVVWIAESGDPFHLRCGGGGAAVAYIIGCPACWLHVETRIYIRVQIRLLGRSISHPKSPGIKTIKNRTTISGIVLSG